MIRNWRPAVRGYPSVRNCYNSTRENRSFSLDILGDVLLAESTTPEAERTSRGVSRREFLKFTAGAAAVAASSATILGTFPSLATQTQTPSALLQTGPASELEEATIAQLQAQMIAGTLTSVSLINMYLSRITAIDARGPFLNSILQTNPDATTIASQLDSQRRAGTFLGPLMGIPILLKDNIDTHDQMQSAAGSLALVGTPALKDSTVAANLRKAGAVVLGKTNLSEWANFRSFFSSSGWSGRGGQCNNPYAIDRNPCGSSSGSGAAPSANLTAVSIGTETDGSIVCPANMNGVVGIKPTVGLVSRAGVVPISHTQDTVGPHARTFADAATVLGVLTGQDPDDPATQLSDGPAQRDYTRFLDPDGLRSARIGVAREIYCGYNPHADRIVNTALEQMRALGAEIIDPADIPNAKQMDTFEAEKTVLL